MSNFLSSGITHKEAPAKITAFKAKDAISKPIDVNKP